MKVVTADKTGEGSTQKMASNGNVVDEDAISALHEDVKKLRKDVLILYYLSSLKSANANVLPPLQQCDSVSSHPFSLQIERNSQSAVKENVSQR